MGLSTVYEHYIDGRGNKFFTSFDNFYGLFIRQIQLTSTECIDASKRTLFEEKMLSMGFVKDECNLFRIHTNLNKFKFRVNGSNNGIANNPIEL